MKENRKVIIFFIVALFMVGLLLVMVVGGKDPAVQEAVVMPPTEASVGDNVQTEDMTEPVAASEETETEPTDKELAPDAESPALKTGLESTNPAGVNLANGDIQLIEMFAFW